MNYEVELKFRIDDWSDVEQKLKALNAAFHEPVLQIDRYYSHPARDFAATDEALRIREVSSRSWLTYKGPKVDATSKTRQEFELQLPKGNGNAENFAKMLDVLGFQLVIVVEKERFHADLIWQERNCKISFDEVKQAGRFVELEVISAAAGYRSARKCLDQLASHLELTNNERRSYRDLLLAQLHG